MLVFHIEMEYTANRLAKFEHLFFDSEFGAEEILFPRKSY